MRVTIRRERWDHDTPGLIVHHLQKLTLRRSIRSANPAGVWLVAMMQPYGPRKMLQSQRIAKRPRAKPSWVTAGRNRGPRTRAHRKVRFHPEYWGSLVNSKGRSAALR